MRQLPGIAWLLLLLALPAWAAPAVETVTQTEYQARLQGMRSAVDECRLHAESCDARRIGADLRVDLHARDRENFDVHWDWLRPLLDQAHAAADAGKRQEMLAPATARLDAMVAESGTQPESPDEFRRARTEADRVLAGAEFRQVEGVSAWDRLMARFWGWVGRMLSGVSEVGSRASWLVPVLEWGFVLLCCVGLMIWVQRALARQRLAVTQEAPVARGEWQEVSRQWAETARLAAEARDWREAVHSLYWATVVELEGRKVWRQHRGRTPREYLRLLEAGSKYRPAVAALTQIFERIWYGLREAEEQDYARVLALYDEVKTA